MIITISKLEPDDEITELCNDWLMARKGLDANIFGCYCDDLGTKYLGYFLEYDDTYYVMINSKLKDSSLCRRVIGWHEYAHLENKIINASSGHNGKWARIWLSKPILALVGYLCILPIVIKRCL